jgi:hypothetical protein
VRKTPVKIRESSASEGSSNVVTGWRARMIEESPQRRLLKTHHRDAELQVAERRPGGFYIRITRTTNIALRGAPRYVPGWTV